MTHLLDLLGLFVLLVIIEDRLAIVETGEDVGLKSLFFGVSRTGPSKSLLVQKMALVFVQLGLVNQQVAGRVFDEDATSLLRHLLLGEGVGG